MKKIRDKNQPKIRAKFFPNRIKFEMDEKKWKKNENEERACK
jgi:hypothetical protein